MIMLNYHPSDRTHEIYHTSSTKLFTKTFTSIPLNISKKSHNPSLLQFLIDLLSLLQKFLGLLLYSRFKKVMMAYFFYFFELSDNIKSSYQFSRKKIVTEICEFKRNYHIFAAMESLYTLYISTVNY